MTAEQQHRSALVHGLSWVIHDQTPGSESKSTIFVPNSCGRLLRVTPCPAGQLLRVYSSENGSDLHVRQMWAGLKTLLCYDLSYVLTCLLNRNPTRSEPALSAPGSAACVGVEIVIYLFIASAPLD